MWHRHAYKPHQNRESLGCVRSVLDGQSFPSFGAASVDDFAAVFGLHAGTKAVGAFARSVVGLIGSFHGMYP